MKHYEKPVAQLIRLSVEEDLLTTLMETQALSLTPLISKMDKRKLIPAGAPFWGLLL